jgi:uncharacterized membrane protein
MQVFGLIVGLVYFIPNVQTLYSSQIIPSLPIVSVIALLQLIAYLAFYKGLEKGQVSLVSPLGASWGLISALLGIIFYHEKFVFHQGLSILFILAGIVGLSIDLKKLIASRHVSLLAGAKEGVIAMFAWGISLFLLVTPTKMVNWFLPTLTFRLLLILFLGGYMLATKTAFVPSKVKVSWGTLFVIGVFDFAAFMSLSLGVLQANSSLILPIASAYALVTVALAWIVLKEKMTLRHIISALAILAGIVGMSV